METEAAAAAGGITAQELLDHQWRFRFKGDLDHERRSLELSARFRCAARNSGRSWPGISQSYFPVPWHAAQDKSRLGHSYLCGPPPCVAAHGTPSRPPSFLSFTFTFTSSPSPASSSSSSSLPSATGDVVCRADGTFVSNVPSAPSTRRPLKYHVCGQPGDAPGQVMTVVAFVSNDLQPNAYISVRLSICRGAGQAGRVGLCRWRRTRRWWLAGKRAAGGSRATWCCLRSY